MTFHAQTSLRMKKLYIALLCTLLVQTTNIYAQCPAGRFINEIFPAVSMTTVFYSSVYAQQMDIYQPVGDTMSHRPIIILAHGGSFISDNKSSDPTIDSL